MGAELALQAIVLGIVEGITEFLPISSTGHLIVVGDLIGFHSEKGKVFEVAIQLAAILAVCWEYRARLVQVALACGREPLARRFVGNLAIAFVPAAVLGLLFVKSIKAHLFNAPSVAVALIVGALAILVVERMRPEPRVRSVDAMTWRDALLVGLAQTLALVPGTSRAGATIIGGMVAGLSRNTATEFSFFLAIPTMFAATFYDVWKHRELFSAQDLPAFAIGFVTSFVAAMLTVRWLLRYISRHDFTAFAWYRIAFGVVVLATTYGGWVDWSA